MASQLTKSDLSNISVDALKGIQLRVEDNSRIVDNIVNEIISSYTKDLDRYIQFIKNCLKDGENPPTDYELEDFLMNLSTDIYFASGMSEQLGIRDDIAKAVYKETYNSVRDSTVGGTIADKNVQAELESQQEQLISICYNRAYRIVKAKVESAQELLASCKKVLGRRMAEIELTKMSGSVSSRRSDYEG